MLDGARGVRVSASHLVIEQEHIVVECQSNCADDQGLHVGSVHHLGSAAMVEQTFPVGLRTAGIGPTLCMPNVFRYAKDSTVAWDVGETGGRRGQSSFARVVVVYRS